LKESSDAETLIAVDIYDSDRFVEQQRRNLSKTIICKKKVDLL